MRIVVLLMALIGALAAGGVGAMWLLEISPGGPRAEDSLRNQEAKLKHPTTPLNKLPEIRAVLPMLVTLPYFLVAGGLLGLLAGILALSYHGKSAAVLLVLAALGPLALTAPQFEWLTKRTDLLIQIAGPCAALLIGGLLALLIRPPALALEGGGDEEEQEDAEDED